ncbi:DUF6351 family protein [Aurantivibrio plasticivorans]
MTRLMAKLVLCFMCVLFVGFAIFIQLLEEKINLIPEAPVASVVGVPEGSLTASYLPAYQKTHPRLSGRPEETFNFPIELGEVGPVEPLFAGTNQYPFLCGKNRHTNAQPIVDNVDGIGVPVFESLDAEELKVVGYSKDCLHATEASYLYNKKGTDRFYPIEEADNDIEQVLINGEWVDAIVRVESGTINRFHYIMAVLADPNESIERPTGSRWNKKLIYQFRGGVGIGKRQGKIRPNDVLKRRFEEIKQGYAVVYSSANQTSNHYNLWLAEDTAARVKRQFVSLYGEPLYTVGVGGSGGAIQQYIIAQNNPNILDAAIALYAYPDMVTQTIHVMDCEPLEYYFDVTDGNDPRWQQWENRSLVEGMNADSTAKNRFNQVMAWAGLLQGRMPRFEDGASECIRGWRGLTPLVHNPNFVHFHKSFAEPISSRVKWTHWDDLKHFYGVNQNGYANSTWDNVGVQYGLEALKEGRLTPEDFLHLNTHVGGWKESEDMQQEKLWLLAGSMFPVDLSFWSHHNMHHSGDGGETPAQRTKGNVEAIAGAYRSGHVFIGYADIPILDVRHYLDGELDMHHATASFSARLRLKAGQGYADNQAIWMAHKDFNPQPQAFKSIDEWMTNLKRNPEAGVIANKPMSASDRCFDDTGEVIAAGRTVWDGDWNNRPKGRCMQVYPRYKTSREVAGGPITSDVFKCHLQPVSVAMNSGVYGKVNMQPYLEELQTTFPDGVCNYALGDAGKPSDMLDFSRRLAAKYEKPKQADQLALPTEKRGHSIQGLNISSGNASELYEATRAVIK